MSRFAHPDLSQTGRLVVGHGTTIKASEPTMPKDISKHRLFADFTGADPRRYDEVAPEAGTVSYPDGNPKTLMGAKKPDPSVVPPIGILHLATAMMNGAEKYGPFNWREKGISVRPYVAAALRHLYAFLDGEDYSADTTEAGRPVHHLGHVMACCAILLDAQSLGINDNRPLPGKTGEAIERYNEEKKL